MEASPPRHRRFQRWLLVMLAVLPFLLPLAQHVWLAGADATGFLSYDAPNYVANGRSTFERGNGFAHPNPYDPAATSPVIYFHWLIWILGFGVKALGADPGWFFVGLGIVAAVFCSACTLRLVEFMLPDPAGRSALFLLTMWGGGALGLAAFVANLANGRSPFGELLAFDPPEGWWFPNWGRNLILTPEAVYHVLAALGWLGILQRRWRLAFCALGALAATHPFSGLQHLLILGLWVGFLALREHTPEAWRRVALAGAMLVIFCGYYFVYLNSFAEHRALQAIWLQQVWTISLPSLLLAAGPPMLVAFWRLYRQRWRLQDRDLFLLAAGIVTLLLMKHDWFIAPHQPVHFGRGYNWLPWWLLALPQLQEWMQKLRRVAGPAAWIALAVAAGLIVSDNVAFLAQDMQTGELNRMHLTSEQREMLGWIDRRDLRGVLLCPDLRFSYLAATYSGARPYLGHIAGTPDARRRWREIVAWRDRGERGPWLDGIDYALLEQGSLPPNFDWSHWRTLHTNSRYVLLGRNGPTP
jgi:hypothetical protein